MMDRKISQQERDSADLVFWQELERVLPWKVIGWTFRQRTTVITSDGSALQLTGSQRNDIIRVTGHGR